jgi:hypothetical protein
LLSELPLDPGQVLADLLNFREKHLNDTAIWLLLRCTLWMSLTASLAAFSTERALEYTVLQAGDTLLLMPSTFCLIGPPHSGFALTSCSDVSAFYLTLAVRVSSSSLVPLEVDSPIWKSVQPLLDIPQLVALRASKGYCRIYHLKAEFDGSGSIDF